MIAQLSHISFATSLADLAHEYRDICEAIARCLYMYKEFGIFTCILVLLWKCVHCLDRTPDCTVLGTGLLLPRWRTEKPARGRYLFYNHFISILIVINTSDRTCEHYMHFFNQVWYPFLKNHIDTDMAV